jgi:hypothetical protein
MNEKRREHRLKANLPIKIISSSNAEVLGSIENISRLGTYLEVDRQIPAGENVDVTLELPAYSQDLSLAGEVRCKGSVFRCSLIRESESRKFYGIGIFFTSFNENQDKERLSKYIDFLTLREEHEIKEFLKRRREKEVVVKTTKQSEEFQKESLDLLKQIQAKLEEILRILQSDNKKRD